MSQEHKNPEVQNPAESEQENTMHRNALLRYVIIMFAVALVLVLLSMVLQTKSSNSTISELHQSSTSALTRAEALQNTNRELEEKLKLVQGTADALQIQLNEALKDKAYAEAENKNLRLAYEALAVVLMGEENAPSPDDYQKALNTVNTMKQYLSPDLAALYDAYMGAKEQ